MMPAMVRMAPAADSGCWDATLRAAVLVVANVVRDFDATACPGLSWSIGPLTRPSWPVPGPWSDGRASETVGASQEIAPPRFAGLHLVADVQAGRKNRTSATTTRTTEVAADYGHANPHSGLPMP